METKINYTQYINSQEWRTRQKEYLNSRPFCMSPLHAGYEVEAAEVNHLRYDRLGSEANSDLEALCYSCHTKLHTTFVDSFGLLFDDDLMIQAAIEEMIVFYYLNEDENKSLNYKFLNALSDKFFDGMKFTSIIFNKYPKSNKFIQLIMAEILHKGKVKEAFHLYETKFKEPIPIVGESRKVENSTNDTIPGKPINLPKFDSLSEILEFKNKTAELNNLEDYAIGGHEQLSDQAKDAIKQKLVDASTDGKLGMIKSFINTNYFVKVYGMSIYFNKIGIQNVSQFIWFIEKYGTDTTLNMISTKLVEK